MFDTVYESLRRATETTIQVQQELFKKWMSFAAGAQAPGPPEAEQAQKIRKKWAEAVAETLTRQREVLEKQFNAGLKGLEAAFAVPAAKDAEELRARTFELWQQSFNCLKQAFEAQAKEFEASVARWSQLFRPNDP
jgi:hypothetical protein